MDARTRTYVAGRFRDHYRRVSIDPPPESLRREWGYIPWQSGGTTMIRHRSMADLGNIDGFLRQESPRHVYYSAGYYDDPAVGVMGAKGWRGADLIFDLDADHLPGVTPETSYRDMLEQCKKELFALLDLLQKDFGFDEMDIIFSGSRGYHVHIRDEDLHRLPRPARREIAEYVRGESVDLESVIEREVVAGVGRETPAHARRLDTERGWGARLHRALMDRVDTLRGRPQEEAVETLQEINGIGEQRATAIVNAIHRSYNEIANGNLDVHPSFLSLVNDVIDEATTRQGAAIDEPVTTDINRLIRLPGSLHGGSALVARRIRPGTLDMFDPLAHAIPETFRDQEILVDLPETTTVFVGGRRRDIEAGRVRVPEYIGMHFMVTGRATKAPEQGR